MCNCYTNILSIDDSDAEIHYCKSAIDVSSEPERDSAKKEFEGILSAVNTAPDYWRFIYDITRKLLRMSELHDIYGFVYKIKTFTELKSLGYFFTEKHPDLPDKLLDIMDFSNFITVIDKSGNEKDLRYAGSCIMIKIKTYELTESDNEIYLACGHNHYVSKTSMEWQNGYGYILNDWFFKKDEVFSETDGYNNTLLLNDSEIYANPVKHCICQKIQVGADLYQGYLPAAGQFRILNEITMIVNAVFERFGYTQLPRHSDEFWSSSEIDKENAICWCNPGVAYMPKTTLYKALPFFRKIPDYKQITNIKR